MFGVLIRPTFRGLASLAVKRVNKRAACATSEIARNFSQLTIQPARPANVSSNLITSATTSILSNPEFLKLATSSNFTQVRTVTKFSMKKGKRKTVKAALKRFKRLDWGIWIRTRSGRHKRLWKKSPNNKYRKRQHVFTNATQSLLLDKMVTNRWRKPKYYVDDPYRPYHSRENYWVTRRKPIDWDY